MSDVPPVQPSAGVSASGSDSNKVFAVLLVVSILVSVLGTWTLLNKADQLPKGEIVKMVKTGPKISLFVKTPVEPGFLNVETVSKSGDVKLEVLRP